MKKFKIFNNLISKKKLLLLVAFLLPLHLYAQNKVVVVPLLGNDPTGNATEADVVAGKTFSNADGVDKVGSLVLGNTPTGNATEADVVAGKTFSNSNGVDKTGSLIVHPVSTTFTNSVGMQFNELPSGSFIMGSPVGEPGRSTREVQHRVTLTNAFRMQITEVTNAQWNKVIVDSLLGSNPSISHSEDSYPVETVSWYDAVFFANRLSLNEGRTVCYGLSGISGTPGTRSLSIDVVTRLESCTGYSLPTEAEWEYAARAGSTKAYANPIGFDDFDTETGNGFNANLHAIAWYFYNQQMQNSNAEVAYSSGTKPVAKKQANAWGLYDMHGNVSEWNWDWSGPYQGDAVDPTGPPSESEFIIDRVTRGGSFRDSARTLRSAARGAEPPGNENSFLGFRLVLSPGG